MHVYCAGEIFEGGGDDVFNSWITLDDGGPVSTVMYIVVSSFSFPAPPTILNKGEFRSHPCG